LIQKLANLKRVSFFVLKRMKIITSKYFINIVMGIVKNNSRSRIVMELLGK
jgi:uncharacterized membrane protein